MMHMQFSLETSMKVRWRDRKIDNVPNGIRIMNFWNPKRSENVRYIVEIINSKPKATIKYWSAVGSFAMGDIESAIKNCANE